jgi:amino acid transporter
LIATAAIAGVAAATGTYEELIAFSTALGVLVDLSAALAAMRLRHTAPELHRPWRARAYPWSIAFAAFSGAALLAALIWEDPFHSLLGTGFAIFVGLGYALAHRGRDSAIPNPA